MTWLAAGILLSSALVLAGPGQAAPDCKTSTGNPACPAPKAAKPSAGPKSRPEPEVVRQAAPSGTHKQAGAQKPQQNRAQRQTVRHSAPHRTYAQTSRGYHQENRQDWNAYGDGRDQYGREFRPPSGPVYDSVPGVPAGSYGCGDACQYRAWFEQYSAWYERYGRSYNAQRRVGGADHSPDRSPGQSSGPASGSDVSPTRFQRRDGWDQNTRERLDPWHGYNSRDGLENGY